jgi:hypothetical protein
MRVSIPVAWFAVSGPAGMTNPYMSMEIFANNRIFELRYLSFFLYTFTPVLFCKATPVLS